LVSDNKPDWQVHIDWCIHNSDAGGSTDCPDQYPYPGCVAYGGRACLMGHAVDSAKANDCENAMRVTLICQCHSESAQKQLKVAGQMQVCNYLKTK
jgi:hypothetical protein